MPIERFSRKEIEKSVNAFCQANDVQLDPQLLDNFAKNLREAGANGVESVREDYKRDLATVLNSMPGKKGEDFLQHLNDEVLAQPTDSKSAQDYSREKGHRKKLMKHNNAMAKRDDFLTMPPRDPNAKASAPDWDPFEIQAGETARNNGIIDFTHGSVQSPANSMSSADMDEILASGPRKPLKQMTEEEIFGPNTPVPKEQRKDLDQILAPEHVEEIEGEMTTSMKKFQQNWQTDPTMASDLLAAEMENIARKHELLNKENDYKEFSQGIKDTLNDCQKAKLDGKDAWYSMKEKFWKAVGAKEWAQENHNKISDEGIEALDKQQDLKDLLSKTNIKKNAQTLRRGLDEKKNKFRTELPSPSKRPRTEGLEK